jgi:integrase
MNIRQTVGGGSGSDHHGIGEPSFAEAIAAIEASAELDVVTKRHWATSLRKVAEYLGLPPESIPARMLAIQHRVSRLHPERLRVNPKTFVNHRANAKAALNWFGRVAHGSARRAPMGTEYRAFLAKIPDRHAREILSPFFRYLSGFGMPLSAATDAHVDAYVRFRNETGFMPFKRTNQRRLVRAWNAAAISVPDWPNIILAEAPRAATHTGPAWEAFPASLCADIEAYCAKLAKPHRAANGGRRRACRPATLAKVRRELIASVRTAVSVGIPLAELTSLAALVQPDRATTILDHYWKKNGEEPSIYTINLASLFLSVARTYQLDATTLEALDDLRRQLEEYRTVGLTEKNRNLVRQVLQGDIWRRVVRLPGLLMAEARAARTDSPVRAAVLAQLAVAVRILSFAPVRLQNLAAIIIDLNLVRPGGPGTPLTLTYPDYDVKNRVPLEFPLDERTTAIIDEYIHFHRPTLMRGRYHDRLFPGTANDLKLGRTLGAQITKLLWKRLGLKITPHQFRHAAGAILLQKYPGNYEQLRRVLGHRYITTTINRYVGLESIAASQRFAELVTSLDLPDDDWP